jgi:hypothetical protein
MITEYSGASAPYGVNPGVESAKSLFFGVEVGEGVARAAPESHPSGAKNGPDWGPRNRRHRENRANYEGCDRTQRDQGIW